MIQIFDFATFLFSSESQECALKWICSREKRKEKGKVSTAWTWAQETPAAASCWKSQRIRTCILYSDYCTEVIKFDVVKRIKLNEYLGILLPCYFKCICTALYDDVLCCLSSTTVPLPIPQQPPASNHTVLLQRGHWDVVVVYGDHQSTSSPSGNFTTCGKF